MSAAPQKKFDTNFRKPLAVHQSQRAIKQAGMTYSSTGPIALVTGATHGIGKEIARGLIRAGMQVALVGRAAQKAERVATELRAEAPGAQVAVHLADLSCPQQVMELGRSLREALPRLDVLVNNAGGYFAQREVTPDGLERTFALNHLGYFVLTQELLGLLKKSAPARVINLSSGAHLGGKLDFSDLQFSRRAWVSGWPAYAQSKLANVLFTRELSRRLAGTKVTVNAVHPGLVASGFGHNNSGWWGFAVKASQVFGRSVEKGADTAVYLATSPDIAERSGEYFVDRRARTPSAAARDDAAAQRLWEVSEELVRSLTARPAA